MASAYKSSSIGSNIPLSEECLKDGRDFISTETFDLNPATKTTSEKQQLTWPGVNVKQRSASLGERLKWLKPISNLQILGFLLFGGGLLLLIQNFFTRDSPPKTPVSPFLYLRNNAQVAVAEAVKASAKTSSSGVLEVFQVYQPVLTPSGPTHQTISSDGSSNTTTIESTETSSSCTLLLMEHSFGFSYGHPFVGMFSVQKKHTKMLTVANRQLYSAVM